MKQNKTCRETVCASCGESYHTATNEGAMRDELAENAQKYPGFDTDELVVVCDDCYKQIMGIVEEHMENVQ